MKRFTKKMYAFLCMIFVLAFSTTSLMAAEVGSYTYTLHFYAGNQGSFVADAASYLTVVNGGDYTVTANEDEIVVSNISSDAVVSLRTSAVSLDSDSKYYVKGMRASGSEDLISAVTVNKDRDYVMAYGVKGNMVAYTVNYVDENGTALLDAETFYGNVGDKPVVAYRYVEGYLPQAYNF